ncbi:MAG: DUF6607 family protein [Pseudomonadota bacterium]
MLVTLLTGCAANPSTNEIAPPSAASASSAKSVIGETSRDDYVFSWMFLANEVDMAPRGGTSRGKPVTTTSTPSDAWQRLREPGLSKQERDRRAILAMAGGYRASFDFLETVGFLPDYNPARPYRSWGTEYVYVVTDTPDLISLQHILVMFFEGPDGQVQGPAVVKHWRQDWLYENQQLNVYAGHGSWKRRSLAADAVAGTWTQAVYQVDDSPRYQSVGQWTHDENYSAWQSTTTWRPLPRREFSVRSDYDALVGTNRHTILPHGWLHEEDNLKAVLDQTGELASGERYLAREYGVNRYDLITDHDFEAGHAYWQVTAPFWADVRQAWKLLLDENALITKRVTEGMPLLMVMLNYAAEIQTYDQTAGRAFIQEQLAQHFSW